MAKRTLVAYNQLTAPPSGTAELLVPATGDGYSAPITVNNTGDETAFDIDLTVNKASGSYTALKINAAHVSAPGASNLLADFQVGGVTVASIDSSGIATLGGLDATTEGNIDHNNLQNVGTNTHAQIDSHIADGTTHFADAAADGNDYVRRNSGWVVANYFDGDYNSLSNLPTLVTAINDLSDVANTTPADRHVFVYDGTINNRYENRLLVEADISDLQIYALDSSLTSHTGDASIHFTEASIDHTAIQNVGTNTHAQIDSHIADTSVHFPDTKELLFAASGVDEELTVGTGKENFRMPYALTLTEVRAAVSVAPTGSGITIDINEDGVSIFSTLLTIDAGEETSLTAAVPAVISDAALADNAKISVDIDAVGSTTPGTGLKITLIGTRA